MSICIFFKRIVGAEVLTLHSNRRNGPNPEAQAQAQRQGSGGRGNAPMGGAPAANE